MSHNKSKTPRPVDYKFTCRCCLKSETEFYKLDSQIVARNLFNDDEDANNIDDKITLLECLLNCLHAENVAELPLYICIGCMKSLQTTYYFLQNARRAHEILCRKLCPDKQPQPQPQPQSQPQQRFNGERRCSSTIATEPIKDQRQIKIESNAGKETSTGGATDKLQKVIRYDCKICGAVIYSMKELKQHTKLHADENILYCKKCNFVAKDKRQLSLHCSSEHINSISKTEDVVEQPKPEPEPKVEQKMEIDANDDYVNDSSSAICTMEDMELLIPTVFWPQTYKNPRRKEKEKEKSKQRAAKRNSPKATSTVAAPPPPPAPALSPAQTRVPPPAPVPTPPPPSLPPPSPPPTAPPTTTTTTTVFEELQTFKEDVKCQSPINDLSITSEFLVMPDGSLKQLNDNGVVFDYINASLDNVFANDLANVQSAIVSTEIDVNDLIIEEALPKITNQSTPAARYKCELCVKVFTTAARLKSHQLTHTNLPKFYCEQCSFYSLRSTELVQHYKLRHNIDTGCMQLDAKIKPILADELKLYSCDLCLFETRACEKLRQHYQKKHMIFPSEVQLRPSWSLSDEKKSIASIKNQIESQTEIPLGIQYPPVTSLTPPSSSESPIVYTSTAEPSKIPTTTTATHGGVATTFEIFPGEMPGDQNMIGDMQDFIDNTDVAAICTIPADGMPIPDGGEIIVDNNVSLDFDAERLFEEFEHEDVEATAAAATQDDDDNDDDDDDDEEEEEEEAENEDENDNNEEANDQNLFLTSDDDDLDDFDDEQSKNLQKPYCIYCNKKFTSQYKFENHMFVHRGLAPYRCELCTNIYDMKRALIRHYKAVHKRMPTRDMVQARGDKVSIDRTKIEKLQVDVDKTPALMCAKCPFECEMEVEMRSHLNAHHGITDGVASQTAGGAFIIRKLPFECPRCIRTFAAKASLTRHLQRSHLVDTIIEWQSSNSNATAEAAPVVEAASSTHPVSVVPAPPPPPLLEVVQSNNLHINNSSSSGSIAPIKRPMALTTAVASSGECEKQLVEIIDIKLIKAPQSSNTTTTTTTKTTTTTQSTSTINSNNTNINETSLRTAAAELMMNIEELPPTQQPSMPRTPVFICRECNFTCDQLSIFNEHQLDHEENGRPSRRNYSHKCSICGCAYRTIMLLKYHMKRHMPRPFHCPKCPKTFVMQPELDNHLATHALEMPYKCEVIGCQKAFNYKHHLKRHQSTAHSCKRYACALPDCGRKLSTRCQLMEHMKLHRGTHAYRCPRCPRAYTRRKPLRMHAQRVHDLILSEDDMAEIYRKTIGYTNPHDLKVITATGQLLRRSDAEAAAAAAQRQRIPDTEITSQVIQKEL